MQNNKNIEAVIFDWAGTLIDFGSLATIEAMKKVFLKRGVNLSKNIIKINMGIKKSKHVQKLLDKPVVKKQWIKIFKRNYNFKDVIKISDELDRQLLKEVKNHFNIIPNAKKIFKILKKNKIKIATTTGYSTKIFKLVKRKAKKNGLITDSDVCVDQVKKGRPYPDMCLKNLKRLKINNNNNCIKIDDSLAGIIEGKKSNMITVGLSMTGIQLGLTYRKYLKLNKVSKKHYSKRISKDFFSVGSDYVVNDLFDFQKILKKYNIY